METHKRLTAKGDPYWKARDVQAFLGYERWENFDAAIGRAKMACEVSEQTPAHHFLETTKMITAGKGAERRVRDLLAA